MTTSTLHRRALTLLLLACAALLPWHGAQAAEQLRVGSKRFTESYILGEIVAQTARATGARAEHRQGLGSTAVVVGALKLGAIDVYPEYLGTVVLEILRLPANSSDADIARGLAALGLAMDVPLGFSNGYALATTAARARELSLRTVGDLRAHPRLTVALSQEFIGRADGWPGLAARYRLPQQPVGIDHGLSYDALAAGRIAVTDIYTTDAKIESLGLTVLDDDLAYFPRYDAVLLYRADLPARAPTAWRALQALRGRIDTARMIRMNGDAELRGRPFDAIAAAFVAAGAAVSGAGGAAPGATSAAPGGTSAAPGETSVTPATPATRVGFVGRLFGPDLARLTREHVTLVAVSLLAGVVLGVPLGALAATQPRWRQPVYAVVGVLQTIPALALLAALIPLLGRIGAAPAVVALSLYALLPIVRNTAAALLQVSPGLRQAGTALGMTTAQRWRHVDLPLALPVILAGVKTAAVTTVGTATIAAFIGAGGYGERIAQGLALNDGATLLAGAVPAAVLALATQAAFEGLERWARGSRPA